MKKVLGIYSNLDRRWVGDGFPVRHSVARDDDDHVAERIAENDRVSKRATLATPYRTVKAKSSR
jgi:hypothetical protein